MYTIPPALPTTSDSKPGNNMHFRPIDLAQKSSVQTMDQSLLNSSLNLLDDLPQLQSSSSNGQIPCGQTTPQGSAHESSYPVLPTPYINQTAVNQHMGAQPTLIPSRMSTSPMNLQPPKKMPSLGKSGPICWNCGEVGHQRRNCPNPSYCSKCKQKGHLPMKCPLKGKRKETSQMPQKVQQMSVEQRFSSIRNKCIHCGGDDTPG